jgi:hypothetical protein
MKRIVAVSLIVSLTTGCVSLANKPAELSTLKTLDGQPMTYTTRDRSGFAAMTAGAAAFALVGAIAMLAAGGKILDENHIADPSTEMGEKLVNAFAAKYGSHVVSTPIKTAEGNIDQIAKDSNGARFAIDVQTINWGFSYFPTDWTHYRLFYVAKAKLINLETRQVIAEGGCKIIKKDNANAPTYDQLVENQAALLKQMINNATSECLQQMQTEAFKV